MAGGERGGRPPRAQVAPPIPGLRQPVQIRRRTPGDVLAGLGATVLLVALTVGVPIALFTAAAALTPAVISHGPPRPAHSVSAQLSPSGLTPAEFTPAIPVTQAGLTAAQVPQSHHAPNSDKMYTVNPPVGRFHESLWEIAQNHLGDGRRYREIFELNQDRVQPDGSKLTIASLIRPGWQLLMPKDAHGPGIEAVTPKLAGELGLAGHPSQRGVGTEDPGLPVGQAPSGSVRDHGIWASPATPAQQAPGWPYELSAASLLAAGVLAALGRKRREQLWRRAFGRRIAGPEPDAALAEKALRLGADDPTVRMLDTGLRYLS